MDFNKKYADQIMQSHVGNRICEKYFFNTSASSAIYWLRHFLERRLHRYILKKIAQNRPYNL
jgi:hypothetical protein